MILEMAVLLLAAVPVPPMTPGDWVAFELSAEGDRRSFMRLTAAEGEGEGHWVDLELASHSSFAAPRRDALPGWA
jgi:hypothetical protein